MITADNILSHEFIGLETEITNSTNPQIIGLNGRIEDETKSLQNLQMIGNFSLAVKKSL